MTQQSVLVAKNNSYDKSINDERLKLITYDYTLDHVNMTDNHAQFVDKDNYNAFLKIKTKSGFFKRIIYNYGIYIYITSALLYTFAIYRCFTYNELGYIAISFISVHNVFLF